MSEVFARSVRPSANRNDWPLRSYPQPVGEVDLMDLGYENTAREVPFRPPGPLVGIFWPLFGLRKAPITNVIKVR